MLDLEEFRGELEEAIRAAFVKPVYLDQFTKSSLKLSLVDYSSELYTFDLIVKDFLDWVSAHNGRAPEVFEKLITAKGDALRLRALCQKILELPLDPFHVESDQAITSQVLENAVTFCDRESLREAVESLVDDYGPRVLLVGGPPKVGKSHCLRFLLHLRQNEWKGLLLTSINLALENDPAMGPGDLTRRLAILLGIPENDLPVQRPEQTEPRWIGDLVGWFVTKLKPYPGRVWIVLDGFRNPLVPKLTHDLIYLLAIQLREVALARLILLDYPSSLDELGADLELQTLDYLDVKHLEGFLQYLVRVLKIQEPEAANKLLVEIESQLPMEHEAQMEFLGRLLPKIVRKVRKAAAV